MVFIPSLVSSLLLAGSAFALPTVTVPVVEGTIERRALDAKLFANLNLMEQYSSAAYCGNNQNSPGDAITCKSGTCDLVQADKAQSVIEYASALASDVTGFVALDPTNKLIVVVFRGTASLDNWITNLKFNAVDTDLCKNCTAHAGFWQSWVDSRTEVLAAVKTLTAANPTYKVVVTGHSLGGAIATLAAAELRNLKYSVDLYTYGAPRIADETLSGYITQQGNNYRVTHYNDVVPQVPPMFMGFVHISPEYYIGTKNFKSVGAGDVKMLEGMKSEGGNAGHRFTDVLAHLWYFNGISNCEISNIFG